MDRWAWRWNGRVAAVTVAAATACGLLSAGGAGPAAAAGGGGVRTDVVGGQDAPEGQFPWMVRLSMGCGGAMITQRVVLTAAHCVHGTGENRRIAATVGKARLSGPGGQTVTSSYVVRSPRYGRTTTFDWALVELAEPVSVPPVAFVGQGDTSPESGVLTVLGWGATSEAGPQSDTLRYANVPFVSDDVCARAYGSRFRADSQMCAGAPQGGVDACQGDSGGPLVKYVNGGYVEVGIVSYGIGCGRAGYPGVYAEVQSFADEIRSHLDPRGQLVRHGARA
jgi:secreted trypsin-like serine protease